MQNPLNFENVIKKQNANETQIDNKTSFTLHSYPKAEKKSLIKHKKYPL